MPIAPHEYDSVFLNSRREAIVIFTIWLVALLWSVPYCYLNGYLADGEAFDPDSFQLTWGIPSWQFYGIAAPWFVAVVATTLFCFLFMKDDDLGKGPEDLEAERLQAAQAAQAADAAGGEGN